MKAVVSSTEKVFVPIKIEITIHDKYELQELYHRLNVPYTFIADGMAGENVEHEFRFGWWNVCKMLELFREIQSWMKYRGIKP